MPTIARLSPIIATALLTAGCDKEFRVLDRGHAVVTGLHAPDRAIEGVTVDPQSAQTRQPVVISISPSLLGDGDALVLVNESLNPPATLLDAIAMPEAGQTVSVQGLTVQRDGEGAITISFIAGQAAATGALEYGDNQLRFSVLKEQTEIADDTVVLSLMDFWVPGVNLSALSPPLAAADADLSAGWMSSLPGGPSAATDPGAGQEDDEYLATDFFGIVNE